VNVPEPSLSRIDTVPPAAGPAGFGLATARSGPSLPSKFATAIEAAPVPVVTVCAGAVNVPLPLLSRIDTVPSP
jgi:hypothetical protein